MFAPGSAALLVPERVPCFEVGKHACGDGRGRKPRIGEKRGRKAPEIVLTNEERGELEGVVVAGSSPQRAVKRARVVLLAAEGKGNREIARIVGLSENVVGKWRRRFRKDGPVGLEDDPRPGRPSPYAAEQKARVIQKAIEAPRDNGLPFSHWSSPDLARLARDAGIASAIHPSTVWRWLNDADLQPHRSRYWLKITDPEFETRMKDVTSLYLQAPKLAKLGIPVFCFDEKTNIQALERQTPDLPMRPGKPQRRDHRYHRHGTTTLLGVFQVASGKVWGDFFSKRPAPVVAGFLRRVCESVPQAPKIHFVMDQLNTHWSHDVCEVVAARSGVPYDRKKHRTGALRRAFLADATKCVVVHFTPIRGSWLDQIEVWLSTLGRKQLSQHARGSCPTSFQPPS